MIFKKGELEHLWAFYLFTFLHGVSMMIFPFIVIYFIDLGFSFFQISVITSVFWFCKFLFEIPTGAFADGFSRKYSVVTGFFIVAIFSSLIPLTKNLYLIAFFWGVAGMGMTFTSGAEEAWIIDNLNQKGRKDLHHEYFVKSRSFSELGAIFAPVIGAVLVKMYSIKMLWFVFGFGFFVNALLIIFFTHEHFVAPKLRAFALLKRAYHNSKMGLVYSVRHKIVFYSILGGLFMQLMTVSAIAIQPFLVSLGMPEHQLGYVYSVAAGVVVITSLLSGFYRRYRPQNVISVVILIVLLLDLCLSFVAPPFFIVASAIFIINGGLFGLGAPIMQTFLHSFIPGRIRATTMSVSSMAGQLVFAVSSLVTGVFLDLFGPQKVLVCGGLFGVFAIFFYQKLNIERKPRN